MSTVKTISVSTVARNDFKDITEEVRHAVKEMGIVDGAVVVFVPHTTAGITINENADPDVRADMMRQLDEVIPWSNSYRHYEGNSAAHIKASMMGFSEPSSWMEESCCSVRGRASTSPNSTDREEERYI